MTEGYLQSRGIAYRTNEFQGGRPTLVFVHGLSGSASAWFAFEERLTDEYNLVTYDLRGHGLSKKYPRYADYGLTLFGDDLRELLAHLNINSYSLVAHSFGTVVALEAMVAEAPVTSAIFLSINYRISTLTRSRLALPFALVLTSFFRMLPFSPRKGSRIDYRSFGYSPDWSLKRIVPEIGDMTLRIYLYCLQHIYLYKSSSWSTIAVPTLLIHGRVDSFVPVGHAVAAQKDIPNAQLKIIEGANHMLVINNVAEVTEAIKDFIK